MAVRSTMASLISRARLLINDPNAATFSDQQVQDALDNRRQDVKEAMLRPQWVRQPGGNVLWSDYYADLGDWEDEMILKNVDFSVITPDTTEPILGHWVFNSGQVPPVYMTGQTYDIYAAAADLLEKWAAVVMLDFDFGMGRGDSFSRSQKHSQILLLAEQYRSQSRPYTLSMDRSDAVEREGGMAFWDWAPF